MNKVFSRGYLSALLVPLACVACFSHAQQKVGQPPASYPNKPIRVLVGTPPGSGSDITVRIVAQKLSARWGYSVVVDNRPGAVGAIALELAARAAPDGYTLVSGSGQNLTAMLLKTVTTDIPTALTPIVQMISQPYLLVVTPSLPVNSVKELIAYAKTKPLVYASSGMGSVVHLGMEMFKSMAGVELTHVPYKGSGQSMVDVMSGQVQLAITNSLTATPLVKSGKLRTLAVTTLRRSQAFPDLPTISEAGVPGYELSSWYGLWAPAKTPSAIILALNREIGQIMATPEMKEKLAADGAEPAAPNSPAEFKNIVASQIEKWQKFLKTSRIKFDRQ